MSIITEEALDRINVSFDKIIAGYEKLVESLLDAGIIDEVGWFKDPYYIIENQDNFNIASDILFKDRENDEKIQEYYELVYGFIMLFTFLADC